MDEALNELLNTAPCGFLSCNDNGTILLVNATLADWLGYAPEELTGRSVEAILSIGGRIFYQTHISPLLKLQGRAAEIYFSLKAKNGQALDVLTNAERRERTGAFANDFVFLPMSQRRQYEDELLQAKKLAEEASQAKARFLSMMSHELRTPMNAILGFAQLLKMENKLDAQQDESIDYILDAGKHLLGLINEVLDIARIEAGELDIRFAPLLALDAMAEAFNLAQPLAAGAGIELHMQTGPYDARYVQADRGRVRQVLLNLLANAIKYNRPGGSVTLGCERVLDENPQGPGEDLGSEGSRNQRLSGEASRSDLLHGERLRFVVSDTGPGIAPHDIEKLFEPFERLGREGGAIEGTGLGLSVCKRLVEAMHGHIGVHSIEAEGSRFWVELPVAPHEDETGTSRVLDEAGRDGDEAHEATTGLLYVEDNAGNLRLMQHILAHRPGVHLLAATSGAAGLEMAQANHPDLILLDVQLPDMAGNVVLDHLRSDQRTHDIPVVMLSADATPAQITRLLEQGAHDYLTKPIEVEKFLLVLDALLEEKTAAQKRL
jgi:PAS domain S-box-containing protein